MGRQIGAFFAERRTRFEEMFRHVCDCLGGAERNLSTTMGHSTGLIREQCPVW